MCAYVSVYVHHMHIKADNPRICQIPWLWSCKPLWTTWWGFWEPDVNPLQEKYVLSISESSLTPLESTLLFWLMLLILHFTQRLAVAVLFRSLSCNSILMVSVGFPILKIVCTNTSSVLVCMQLLFINFSWWFSLARSTSTKLNRSQKRLHHFYAWSGGMHLV